MQCKKKKNIFTTQCTGKTLEDEEGLLPLRNEDLLVVLRAADESLPPTKLSLLEFTVLTKEARSALKDASLLALACSRWRPLPLSESRHRHP